MNAALPVTPEKEPHAITRARERYGVELSLRGLTKLRNACRDRKGIMLRTRDGGEWWAVLHANLALIAVFDRQANRVVTILPRDAACTSSRKKPGKRNKPRLGLLAAVAP